MNPETQQFERITPENVAKTRNWTKFQEGETVSFKGVLFYIHEIGESWMVIKLVKK